MHQSGFNKRASALENEFFHRIDQKLIQRLQECRQLEVDEDALAIATGITDRRLLDELLEVEITPKTLVALSLFPAVYVAWAGGHVAAKERDAVLKAAHQLGVGESSPAWSLIAEWLKRRPTDELWKAWSDFVHGIQPTVTASAFRQLREAAMQRAGQIAEAEGGFLGIHKVSKAEQEAIEKLDAAWRDASKQERVRI